MMAGVFLALGCLCGARGGVAEPPAQVLDDVVVTGERTGPGLWHVHRGTGHLWILGTVAPLPKGMIWRSTEVERILEGTSQVLVAKPFDIGILRGLWLLITQRDLFMIGGGRRLKDVMPPDSYARFRVQRAKLTDDESKWERYRPIIAAAFLQETALHRIGLSSRLDLGSEVRALASKHHVRVEEIRIAGLRDVLDALKTLPAATENVCVTASLATVEGGLPRLVDRARAWATGDVERMQRLPEPREVDACREAITADAGTEDLLSQVRRAWVDAMEKYLRSGSVTLAVANIDMLLERGGVLDELRKDGFEVDVPSS